MAATVTRSSAAQRAGTAAAVVVAVVGAMLALLAPSPVGAAGDEPVGAGAVGAGPAAKPAEVSAAVRDVAVLRLPVAAGHVAVHWAGEADTRVTIEFAADGGRFGPSQPVELDEQGENHPSGERYGAVMAAGGATRARVRVDRPVSRVTVLAIPDDRARIAPATADTAALAAPAAQAAAGPVAKPAIISRAGWGADETLRFSGPTELWPRAFNRVQKLVVHHTATSNGYATVDDAKAQIRAIYYYHAVTQGWGDIGYHFFVDRFGNVYEGRYARADFSSENPPTPTGEDSGGRVVTAGHTYGSNTATVGIAVLGTFSTVAPSAAAQDALVRLLTWEAARHGLDPRRTAQYRNVVNDLTITGVRNVAEHRSFVATDCPGGTFSTLINATGGVRDRVAAALVTALGTAAGDLTVPAAPATPTATGGSGRITLTWPASGETWPTQSGIAYYEIQRSSSRSGPFSAIEHTTDLTRTFVNRSIRGTYSYRVVAVDGAGNRSIASPVATATAT